MLSKNNFKEKLRKMEEQHQRFSIRTLSVGAVSVLIGLSFLTNVRTVKAATEVNAENPTVARTANQNNDEQTTQDNQKVTSPANEETKVNSLASSTIDTNTSNQIGVEKDVNRSVADTEAANVKELATKKTFTPQSNNQVENQTNSNKQTLVTNNSTASKEITLIGKDPNNDVLNKAKVLIPSNLYIYEVVRLTGAKYDNGDARMIIATDRQDPGQKVHVFVTNSTYQNVDPANSNKIINVDNNPDHATNYVEINVDGKTYRIHNTGIYNLELDNNVVSTQGCTNVQSTTGVVNAYGLGVQNDINYLQKVDIDPVRSKQEALKYYTLGSDNKYYEYEDQDKDIESIYVEGLSGQKFTIENVNNYKRVIKKYYLTNGDSLANDGNNYTGTISLFQPGRYYKKVLYDWNGAITQTIVFNEVANNQGLYDGSMRATLYLQGSSTPSESLTLAPGEDKQFSNGTYARNPYIPNDVTIDKLFYNPLGSLIPVDEDGNVIGDKVQYNNSLTDPSKAAPTAAPVIPGYSLAYPNLDKNYNPTKPGEDHRVIYIANPATASITYIDDDTNKELATDDASGHYDQDIDFDIAPEAMIEDYERMGYVLVSSNYDPDGKFGLTPTNYEVHLKHGVVHVTPENPVEPGEVINPDYPGGGGPTYPINVDQLEKTVTRTINYIYARNNMPIENNSTLVQMADFKANGYVDKVTGNWVTVKEDGNGDYTITGSATGPNWEPTQEVLPAVESPEVENFNPDRHIIDEVNVDSKSSDINEVVKYLHTETANFIYKDLDNNDQILETATTQGDYDATIRYNPASTIKKFENAGYVLVSNPYKPNTTKYKDTIDNPEANTFVITFKHGVEPVTENKTVKRTIKYVYEDGTQVAPTVTENIDFTGRGIRDKVTGQYVTVDGENNITGIVGSLDWTPENGHFDPVVSPIITGFSPDKLEIVGQTVLPISSDIKEEVIYKKNVQAAQINYWDDLTGQSLGVDTVIGRFSEPITFTVDPTKMISNLEDQGYQLISNKGNYDLTQSYTYSHNNEDNIFNLYFTHGTEGTTTEKQIKRTINYSYQDSGDKAADSVVQTATFTGTGIKDKVTGNLVELDANNQIVTEDGQIKAGSYNWIPETATFEEVTSPEIPAYVADKKVISATEITPEDSDSEVNVLYVPENQQAQIIYKDITTNQDLKTATIPGQYGQVIDYSTKDRIQEFEDQGYELVSDGFTPGTKFGDTKDNTFYVLLKHGVVPVTPENPGKPGDPITPENPDGPKYPMDSADLQRDVTRTVNYLYLDGSQAAESVSDTLTFKASGYIDKVTGEYVVLDSEGNIRLDEDGRPVKGQLMWTSNGSSFDRVDSPHISGYTPDYSYISEIVGVTQKSPDSNFVVHYYLNREEAQITYVDKTTGQTLRTDSIFGKYNDPISFEEDPQAIISAYEKRGYVQVDKDQFTFVNGQTKYGDSQENPKVNNFVVYLAHGTIPVGPDNDFTPETPVNPDDPDSPTYPFYASNLQSTVNRTIDYVYGKTGAAAAPTKIQSLNFKGYGVIDKVTGQLVELDDEGNIKVDETGNPLTGEINWTSNGTSLAEVTSPIISGYTADRLTVPEVANINGETGDMYETVTYNANPEQATITYIDTVTNKTLQESKVDGKYQESIFFNDDPATVIANYEKSGYVQVDKNKFTFVNGETTFGDSQENPEVNHFVVYLTHGTVPIDPENPGKPGEPINPEDPNGPKYPAETGVKELSKTVTRTINYVYQDGATAAPSKIQTLTFTGNGVLDKVTGQLVELNSDGSIKVDANGNPILGKINWIPESGTFNAIASPEIVGFTPDLQKVGPSLVNADSNNLLVTVVYSKLDEPVTPEEPSQPEEPGKPATPEEPAKPTEAESPAKPNESKPSQSIDSVSTIKPDHINTSNHPVSGSTSAVSNKEETSLPQTGVKKSQETTWGLIGLGIASILGILGLKDNKRKN